MKINLSKVGSGAEKIDRGEFMIQETSTKREIDLDNDWETCFLPGQRVGMSMIFRRTIIDHGICPGCAARKTTNGLEENKGVDCSNCGMTYSRQVVENVRVTPPKSRPSIINLTRRDSKIQGFRPRLPQLESRPSKRKRERDADDDMRLFRRVCILDEIMKGAKNSGESDANTADNLAIGEEVMYFSPYSGGYHLKLCIIIAIIYDEHVKRYGPSLGLY